MAYRKTCPACMKSYIPDLAKRPDFSARKLQWQVEGELIQYVWPSPQFTPTQREQLQTGLCSDKCWNEYLGYEEGTLE
jgi:hypothetical protein